ncbi:MFS transporter [Candidatus Spongiihabitans sp.]|uniref:MFS transporter n=1 Tax=Candidatus Spongiihabitans sp. TaxID=3101308 RepID=UPI003C7AB7A0
MMQQKSKHQGTWVVLASMLLVLVLGSVHAFSVFLEPMERHFQVSRSQVSLTYSFTLLTLTVGVLFGHRLYGLLRPAGFAIAVCTLALIGALIAASANHIATVWFGYSLLFGFANGLGYGFALQISAQSNLDNKGFVMGLVTASYALGAVLSPWPLAFALSTFGLVGAMLSLALVLLLIMPIAGGLLDLAQAELHVSASNHQNSESVDKQAVFFFWLAFGLAVMAGLMATGHATAIAQQAGLDKRLMLIAPSVLALFSMAGSLLGGWIADRISFRVTLTLLPLLSAVSLLLLSLFLIDSSVLFGLGVIGFAYGAIISVYPAAIATRFGVVEGVRIYGKVFIAWGIAGFLGPWVAGKLYDIHADYRPALIVASIAGICSALCIGSIKPKSDAKFDNLLVPKSNTIPCKTKKTRKPRRMVNTNKPIKTTLSSCCPTDRA